MPEISSSSFSENGNSNNAAAPSGFPESMPPSGVNDSAHAVMGALRRFQNRINGTVSTTGSARACVYTPSGTSFPTSYVQGECYRAKAGFTSVGTDTLNVNAIGAKRLFRPSTTESFAPGAGMLLQSHVFDTVQGNTRDSGAGRVLIVSGVPIDVGGVLR